jgi:hypothetical protein
MSIRDDELTVSEHLETDSCYKHEALGNYYQKILIKRVCRHKDVRNIRLPIKDVNELPYSTTL